jgi:hypothetical protein
MARGRPKPGGDQALITRIDPGTIRRIPVPLGFNATPWDRRNMAAAFAVVAGASAFAALRVSPLWTIPTLLFAVLALWMAREGMRPYYINDTREAVAAIWEVVPGERVGPVRLGTPDAETIHVLRRTLVFDRRGDRVVCTVPCGIGQLVVVAGTDEPLRSDGPPDPVRFTDIESIATTSPSHILGDGVRPGADAADIVSALGLPEEVDGHDGLTVLRWRGLEAGVRRGTVEWLGVFPLPDEEEGPVGAGDR